jgi:hypothetical protein
MIDHPRITTIPPGELDQRIRPDALATVAESVSLAMTEQRCIGYRRYARNKSRLVWFVCRNTRPLGYDRCAACVVSDHESRASEAVDDTARAANRTALARAIAPLRYSYDSPPWRESTRGVIRDIEHAVRQSAGGGMGNYWLALRLLAEVD